MEAYEKFSREFLREIKEHLAKDKKEIEYREKILAEYEKELKKIGN